MCRRAVKPNTNKCLHSIRTNARGEFKMQSTHLGWLLDWFSSLSINILGSVMSTIDVDISEPRGENQSGWDGRSVNLELASDDVCYAVELYHSPITVKASAIQLMCIWQLSWPSCIWKGKVFKHFTSTDKPSCLATLFSVPHSWRHKLPMK